MKLSKKQREDLIHFWVVMAICIMVIGLVAVFLHNNPKPEPDKVDPGYTISEGSEELETTNPDYLEKYFETWE